MILSAEPESPRGDSGGRCGFDQSSIGSGGSGISWACPLLPGQPGQLPSLSSTPLAERAERTTTGDDVLNRADQRERLRAIEFHPERGLADLLLGVCSADEQDHVLTLLIEVDPEARNLQVNLW